MQTKDCIHCGLCTRKCAFLQKYQMDLQGFAEHPELVFPVAFAPIITTAFL